MSEKKKLIVRLVFSLLLIAVIIMTLWFRDLWDDRLKIVFLDIGQGDATLIRTPDRRYILIDTGPDTKVVEELSSHMPFWQRKIDYLIITHPDLDHLGGTPEVLKRYDVENVYMVDVTKGNKAYMSTKAHLTENSDINWDDLREADDFVVGCCVRVDVLWPDQDLDYETIDKTNNLSTAIWIEYGEFDMYMGGDLDAKIEDSIIQKVPFDTDILKVGHHGSLTSTSEGFLDIIRPEYAIISAGKDNRYGHPKQEILDRLQDRNIVTYITYDTLDGVVLLSDGDRIWLPN